MQQNAQRVKSGSWISCLYRSVCSEKLKYLPDTNYDTMILMKREIWVASLKDSGSQPVDRERKVDGGGLTVNNFDSLLKALTFRTAHISILCYTGFSGAGTRPTLLSL